MVDLLSNKEDVLPVLKEGYYLRNGDQYYEIIGKEMLGQFVLTIGSPAAPIGVGAQSAFFQFDNIKPRRSTDRSGPKEFYNISIGVRGPGRIKIKQPAGQPQLGSHEKPDDGAITRRNSSWLDPRAVAWIDGDTVPQFSLENDDTVPIWSRVYIQGVKYAVKLVCDENVLQLLREKAIPSEPIRLGGLPLSESEF